MDDNTVIVRINFLVSEALSNIKSLQADFNTAFESIESKATEVSGRLEQSFLGIGLSEKLSEKIDNVKVKFSELSEAAQGAVENINTIFGSVQLNESISKSILKANSSIESLVEVSKTTSNLITTAFKAVEIGTEIAKQVAVASEAFNLLSDSAKKIAELNLTGVFSGLIVPTETFTELGKINSVLVTLIDNARIAGQELQNAFSKEIVNLAILTSIQKLTAELKKIKAAVTTALDGVAQAATASSSEIEKISQKLEATITAIGGLHVNDPLKTVTEEISADAAAIEARAENIKQALKTIGIASVADVTAKIDALKAAVETLQAEASKLDFSRGMKAAAEQTVALERSLNVAVAASFELQKALVHIGSAPVGEITARIKEIEVALETLKAAADKTDLAKGIAKGEYEIQKLKESLNTLKVEISGLQFSFDKLNFRSSEEIATQALAVGKAFLEIARNSDSASLDMNRGLAQLSSSIRVFANDLVKGEAELKRLLDLAKSSSGIKELKQELDGIDRVLVEVAKEFGIGTAKYEAFANAVAQLSGRIRSVLADVNEKAIQLSESFKTLKISNAEQIKAEAEKIALAINHIHENVGNGALVQKAMEAYSKLFRQIRLGAEDSATDVAKLQVALDTLGSKSNAKLEEEFKLLKTSINDVAIALGTENAEFQRVFQAASPGLIKLSTQLGEVKTQVNGVTLAFNGFKTRPTEVIEKEIKELTDRFEKLKESISATGSDFTRVSAEFESRLAKLTQELGVATVAEDKFALALKSLNFTSVTELEKQLVKLRETLATLQTSAPQAFEGARTAIAIVEKQIATLTSKIVILRGDVEGLSVAFSTLKINSNAEITAKINEIKTALQSIIDSAGKMPSELSRAINAAAQALSPLEQKLKEISATTVETQQALNSLNVRSTAAIVAEIRALEAEFAHLNKDVVTTAENFGALDKARFGEALKEKIRLLNGELNGIKPVVNSVVEALARVDSISAIKITTEVRKLREDLSLLEQTLSGTSGELQKFATNAGIGMMEAAQKIESAISSIKTKLASLAESTTPVQAAFNALNMRSAEAIKAEIRGINEALLTVSRNSGFADVSRAASIAAEKVAALKAEMNGVTQAESHWNWTRSLASMAAFTVAMVGISKLIQGFKEMIATGMGFEVIEQKLRFATGSVTAAKEEWGFLREVANKLGLDVTTLGQAYGSLTAASKGTQMEGQKTKDLFEAMSKVVAILHLKADDVTGVFKALEQMMSKGKVQAEELRGQLGDRLPGAFSAVARAMGVTTGTLDKLMKSGKVTADEMLPKLTVELNKMAQEALPGVTNTLQAQLNLLKNSMTDIFIYISQSGLFKAITDGIKSITDGFKKMEEDGSLKKFAKELSDDLTNIGSAIKSIGVTIYNSMDSIKAFGEAFIAIKLIKMGAELATWVTGLGGVRAALTVLGSALGGIPGIIAGAVVAIVSFTDSWSTVGKIAKDLYDAFSRFFSYIGEKLTNIATFISAPFTKMGAEGREAIKNIQTDLTSLEKNFETAGEKLNLTKGLKEASDRFSSAMKEMSREHSEAITSIVKDDEEERKGFIESLNSQRKELRGYHQEYIRLETATKDSIKKLTEDKKKISIDFQKEDLRNEKAHNEILYSFDDEILDSTKNLHAKIRETRNETHKLDKDLHTDEKALEKNHLDNMNRLHAESIQTQVADKKKQISEIEKLVNQADTATSKRLKDEEKELKDSLKEKLQLEKDNLQSLTDDKKRFLQAEKEDMDQIKEYHKGVNIKIKEEEDRLNEYKEKLEKQQLERERQVVKDAIEIQSVRLDRMAEISKKIVGIVKDEAEKYLETQRTVTKLWLDEYNVALDKQIEAGIKAANARIKLEDETSTKIVDFFKDVYNKVHEVMGGTEKTFKTSTDRQTDVLRSAADNQIKIVQEVAEKWKETFHNLETALETSDNKLKAIADSFGKAVKELKNEKFEIEFKGLSEGEKIVAVVQKIEDSLNNMKNAEADAAEQGITDTAQITKIFEDQKKEFDKWSGKLAGLIKESGKGALEQAEGLEYLSKVNSTAMGITGDVADALKIKQEAAGKAIKERMEEAGKAVDDLNSKMNSAVILQSKVNILLAEGKVDEAKKLLKDFEDAAASTAKNAADHFKKFQDQLKPHTEVTVDVKETGADAIINKLRDITDLAKGKLEKQVIFRGDLTEIKEAEDNLKNLTSKVRFYPDVLAVLKVKDDIEKDIKVLWSVKDDAVKAEEAKKELKKDFDVLMTYTTNGDTTAEVKSELQKAMEVYLKYIDNSSEAKSTREVLAAPIKTDLVVNDAKAKETTKQFELPGEKTITIRPNDSDFLTRMKAAVAPESKPVEIKLDKEKLRSEAQTFESEIDRLTHSRNIDTTVKLIDGTAKSELDALVKDRKISLTGEAHVSEAQWVLNKLGRPMLINATVKADATDAKQVKEALGRRIEMIWEVMPKTKEAMDAKNELWKAMMVYMEVEPHTKEAAEAKKKLESTIKTVLDFLPQTKEGDRARDMLAKTIMPMIEFKTNNDIANADRKKHAAPISTTVTFDANDIKVMSQRTEVGKPIKTQVDLAVEMDKWKAIKDTIDGKVFHNLVEFNPKNQQEIYDIQNKIDRNIDILWTVKDNPGQSLIIKKQLEADFDTLFTIVPNDDHAKDAKQRLKDTFSSLFQIVPDQSTVKDIEDIKKQVAKPFETKVTFVPEKANYDVAVERFKQGFSVNVGFLPDTTEVRAAREKISETMTALWTTKNDAEKTKELRESLSKQFEAILEFVPKDGAASFAKGELKKDFQSVLTYIDNFATVKKNKDEVGKPITVTVNPDTKPLETALTAVASKETSAPVVLKPKTDELNAARSAAQKGTESPVIMKPDNSAVQKVDKDNLQSENSPVVFTPVVDKLTTAINEIKKSISIEVKVEPSAFNGFITSAKQSIEGLQNLAKNIEIKIIRSDFDNLKTELSKPLTANLEIGVEKANSSIDSIRKTISELSNVPVKVDVGFDDTKLNDLISKINAEYKLSVQIGVIDKALTDLYSEIAKEHKLEISPSINKQPLTDLESELAKEKTTTINVKVIQDELDALIAKSKEVLTINASVKVNDDDYTSKIKEITKEEPKTIRIEAKDETKPVLESLDSEVKKIIEKFANIKVVITGVENITSAKNAIDSLVTSIDNVKKAVDSVDKKPDIKFTDNTEEEVTNINKVTSAIDALSEAIRNIPKIVIDGNFQEAINNALAVESALSKIERYIEIHIRTIQDNAAGGLIGGYAEGGFTRMSGSIRGPGSSTSDSIPAMLSNGEFVLRADAVRKWGVGFLYALNAGIDPFERAVGSVATGIKNKVTASAKGFNEGGLIQKFASGGLASHGGNSNISIDIKVKSLEVGPVKVNVDDSKVKEAQKNAERELASGLQIRVDNKQVEESQKQAEKNLNTILKVNVDKVSLLADRKAAEADLHSKLKISADDSKVKEVQKQAEKSVSSKFSFEVQADKLVSDTKKAVSEAKRVVTKAFWGNDGGINPDENWHTGPSITVTIPPPHYVPVPPPGWTPGNVIDEANKAIPKMVAYTNMLKTSMSGAATGVSAASSSISSLQTALNNIPSRKDIYVYTHNLSSHAAGGYIRKMFEGGISRAVGSITGAGTGTSDSIPAMLSNGEFVLKADAVKKWGLDFLYSLNHGIMPNIPKVMMAYGGYVGEAGRSFGSNQSSKTMDTVKIELNIGGKAHNVMSNRQTAIELTKALKDMARGL